MDSTAEIRMVERRERERRRFMRRMQDHHQANERRGMAVVVYVGVAVVAGMAFAAGGWAGAVHPGKKKAPTRPARKRSR